ncbi:MAG: hypothetical protein V1914_02745 [archaeon]
MATNVSDKVAEILFAPSERSVLREVYDIMKPGAVGYVALRQQTDALILHQAILDKAVRGKDSLFYNCYYTTKGWFYQLVFRERQLSVEDLFDVQLDNVRALNFNLHSITSDSKSELKYLRGYYNDRHSELRTCVGAIGKTGSDLEGKVREYNDLRHKLDSFKTKDEQFFDCEFRVRELKRDISDGSHYYNVVNESVLDLGKETKFLGVVEDLLSSSIQLSEHIIIKSRRIERHIDSTRRAYLLVRSQQVAVEALNSAIVSLTEFTLGMHNVLAEGLRGMAGLMEPISGLNDFYPAAVKNLGGLVSSVSEANLMRNIEVEDAVKRFTSNS